MFALLCTSLHFFAFFALPLDLCSSWLQCLRPAPRPPPDMAPMQNFVKRTHSERVAHEASEDWTVKHLKEQCGLVGAKLLFRGVPLKNDVVLSAVGVQPGAEIHAFPPTRRR